MLLLQICRKWLMPRERLLQSQQEDRAQGLTEHHLQQLKAYFTQCRSPADARRGAYAGDAQSTR